MAIEVINPHIFAGDKKIHAFFTLKNEGLEPGGANIEGLNFGFNTGEAPEIIKENRRRLFDAFNLDAGWIAFANQVHSTRVKVVAGGGTFAETDSLITQVPGLALVVQVADCASILLADPQTKMIAAIHAGWRGAAGDIVPRTLNKMAEFGSTPGNCQAFISPCISQNNFEVGPEVAAQFPDAFVDNISFKKPHINLKQFIKHQLCDAGLKSGNIELHPGCTVADRQYYSYRREQENSGRMMAIIVLSEAQI